MIKWFNDPVPCLQGACLTMGNFDGMHLGHRKLIQELIFNAENSKTTPIVLSYLEHPGHYVHFKHPVQILTPRMYKQALFQEIGIDKVYFLNFTSETAHISAESFLQSVVMECFKPCLIVSGYDTHFGYQRQGNSEFLKLYQQHYGYDTLQIPPVYYGDNIISSSLIREKLSVGDLEIANAMLGRPYRLYGTVTHGIQLGRVIGFRTINLNLFDNEQLIPANGVYLSSTFISGKRYFGLTNIGTSPTLKNTAQIEIETHILDFEDDIYEEYIQLDLLEYLREEKRFENMVELKHAIHQDILSSKGLKNKYE
jgi:riboflavin kinase/FMN adenylyltransferase